ncbi:ornithine decarboxylase antizyme [Culicoides brevitarsis]|uniref:ornithine decarboxylase antizyme n=1 Tax=Culicoides brevitarsis TaxID=469753 RepID=UPI00307C58B0
MKIVIVVTLISVPTRVPPLPPSCRNPTASRWVWDRCGGPDVLHERSDHDRASITSDINRKKSFDSSASSEYSDNLSIIDEGCVGNECNSDSDDQISSYNLESGANENEDLINKIRSQKLPTRVTLKLHITENTFSIWETVLNNNNNILYVALPSKINHEASKHSFISLLEFAEEKLHATAIVLCMRSDRPDRQSLVRNFMFLGFQPLDPRSPLAPPPAHAEIGKSKNVDDTSTNSNLYLICHLDD